MAAELDKVRFGTARNRKGLEGRWRCTPQGMVYQGPDEGSQHPFGIAVSGQRFQEGIVRISVRLPDAPESAGKILIGYNGFTQPYLTIGLGGHGAAYVVSEWVPESGWHALKRVSQRNRLVAKRRYTLQLTVMGCVLGLAVDSVPVLDYRSPQPIQPGYLGVFAWGNEPVRFGTLRFSPHPARAFVIMEFSSDYEQVYRTLIQAAASGADVIAENVGERLGPGNILEDIAKGITDCAMVIAEVTPSNPNVFYEVGYAHAIGKPTILVAQAGTELPFDLKIHRCLFYENDDDGLLRAVPKLRRYITEALGRC
jgi:hypothetical protein